MARAHRTAVVASIHDVSPAHTAAVQTLWRLCRDVGLTPALLVVPNWHGQWPLADSPTFVEWLRRCRADGAEIFVHGERHDEEGLARGWRDTLRAVGRTAREGEFLTLGPAAARERIARGRRQLQSLDLHPVGFVPPAWLTRTTTHAVVRELGLAFSEDDARIFVHRRGGTSVIASPAVRWSGRSTSRAHLSRMVAAWRWHRRAAGPNRLALHPQDLAHPVTAHAVRAAVERWAGDGLPLRYGELTA